MKKNFLYLLLAFAIAAFSGCSNDDDDPQPNGGSGGSSNVVEVSGAITANTTWTSANKYLLKGNVFVRSGAKLTIEAGTIVTGDKATKGALIINRGAEICASGTATNPIIFTSSAPRGFRNRGDWGGLVILGYGASSNGPHATIEGISGAADSPDGKYGVGGNDPQDPNSGVDPTNGNSNTCLKYCRIEFAGIALSPNNELNSLTMGGVGPNADMHHIMVSYAGDDAYEWFGGSNNMDHLISYDCWDDDFDSDRGYSGRVQFGVILRNPTIADVSGSRAFEASSNNSAAATPQSTCQFSNITIIGPTVYTGSASGSSSTSNIQASYRSAIEANSNTELRVYNSLVTGFREFGISFNGLNTNTAEFKGIFSFGNVSGTTTGTGPAAANLDITGVNDSTGYQNAFGVLRGSANLTSGPLNLTNPAPILKAGSPYATGAPARMGFETAAYYGAFGTDQGNWSWTSAWVNFDPINAAY